MTLRFSPEWSTDGAALGCRLPAEGIFEKVIMLVRKLRLLTIIPPLDMNNAR